MIFNDMMIFIIYSDVIYLHIVLNCCFKANLSLLFEFDFISLVYYKICTLQAMSVFTELCDPTETGVTDMKYKILEQKYLELLENGLRKI